MKTIYEFTYNFKHYRSTDKDILIAFADIFKFPPVEIRETGLSNYDIELERV